MLALPLPTPVYSPLPGATWCDFPSRWFSGENPAAWGWPWPSANCGCCAPPSGYRIAGAVLGGGPKQFLVVEEFSAGAWTQKTDFPTPGRSVHNGFPIAGAIYVVGGTGASPNHLRDNDQYIPDTWTAKTDCPEPGRRQHGACAVAGLGYIFGGENFASNLGLVDNDEYDPVGNSWASKTDMTTGMNWNSGVGIGDFAYSLYGLLDESDLLSAQKTVDQYDPDGESWATKTSGPDPARWRLGEFVLDNLAYITAGQWRDVFGSNFFTSDHDEYDPDGDSWASRTDLPSPGRSASEGMTIGTAGYQLGGGNASFGAIGDFDEYVLDTWTGQTVNPSGAAAHQCAGL